MSVVRLRRLVRSAMSSVRDWPSTKPPCPGLQLRRLPRDRTLEDGRNQGRSTWTTTRRNGATALIVPGMR